MCAVRRDFYGTELIYSKLHEYAWYEGACCLSALFVYLNLQPWVSLYPKSRLLVNIRCTSS